MDQENNSTLTNILNAARFEFLEHGYQAAGLREIAKRAGVTTGALYGYFKGKEELFQTLVEEHYTYIVNYYAGILNHFFELPVDRQQSDMLDYTLQGINGIMDYIYAHRDAFKLILCCSDGTPYNNLVHQMAEMDVAATHNFIRATSEAGVSLNPVNPTLEHMLTSGMFSTFFELIVHDIPKEESREYVTQMMIFYNAGWAKLMGF